MGIHTLKAIFMHQSGSGNFDNGWFNNLDGRTGIAQEMQGRYQALISDLGGAKALSYQQRSLAERALWLEYWLSKQEKELATGGDFEVGKWTQGVNSLQGIYSKLGLIKKSKFLRELEETFL